jgi:hypothetical protein
LPKPFDLNAPFDDGREEFDASDFTPAVAPPISPDPLEAKRKQVSRRRRQRKKNWRRSRNRPPTHWSTTTVSLEPLVYWDLLCGWVGEGPHGTARARSSEQPVYQSELEDQLARTGRLSFVGGEFQRDEKKVEDAAFKDYAAKLLGE